MDSSQTDLYETLMLMASNDGKAYTNGKDASTAIARAYREHRARLLADLAYDYWEVVRKQAIAKLGERWNDAE